MVFVLFPQRSISHSTLLLLISDKSSAMGINHQKAAYKPYLFNSSLLLTESWTV